MKFLTLQNAYILLKIEKKKIEIIPENYMITPSQNFHVKLNRIKVIQLVVWFILLKLSVSRSVFDDFTVDKVQESSQNFSKMIFITLKLNCFLSQHLLKTPSRTQHLPSRSTENPSDFFGKSETIPVYYMITS